MVKAMQTKECLDVGKLANMLSFTGTLCTVRRIDGGLATL